MNCEHSSLKKITKKKVSAADKYLSKNVWKVFVPNVLVVRYCTLEVYLHLEVVCWG